MVGGRLRRLLALAAGVQGGNVADTVTAWAFDQATGMQAWADVAVDQSKQSAG